MDKSLQKELRERFLPTYHAGTTRYLVLGVKPATVEEWIDKNFISRRTFEETVASFEKLVASLMR